MRKTKLNGMSLFHDRAAKLFAVLAMMVLVVASNLLVETPINRWMTWGALTYPVTYLVTELMNRFYGPREARKVVYFGFIAAIIVSFSIANERIAFASALAFLISQLLDISIFTRLRNSAWWIAPIVASGLATSVDTALFFSLGFAGTDFPWITVAIGDWGVKFGMDLLLLLPFRVFLQVLSPLPSRPRPLDA